MAERIEESGLAEALAEALNVALGAAGAQPGAAWARITLDIDDMRRRLCIADNRRACRATAYDAEDAVLDALSLLRTVANDDEDWPALRDSRIAGVRAGLAAIRRETSVVPGVLSAEHATAEPTGRAA